MTTDIEKIKKKQKRLITQVDARMQSRFMKGNKLPTLQIIASSKNSDQSFLESYIDMKKRNESKTTLIIDEPQWVVRNDKNSEDKFYVAVGNKFLASEVLPKDANEEIVNSYRARGYSILEIPSGYYEAFIDNVDIALTDIAGISTIGALKYISGVRLNEIKTSSYLNAFTKDIIEVGTNDDIQYSSFFDITRIPQEMKSKPLFIHLDTSKKGDKTGIAGVWISKKIINNEISSKELYFKVAFSVSVKAPKGFEISFEKNRNFIRWLKEEAHLNIKGVTSDTFQSVQIQQQLKKDGFNTSILSVDRLENIAGTKQKICLPYQYLRSCIYEKKIELYEKCNLLTEEIIELEREPDGHINHPDNGTSGSKDQADALCIHGDTKIYTISGKHRNIKTLYKEYKNNKLNEWVLSYNTITNQIEPVKIQQVINNGIKDNLIKLTLENGKNLICTDDHKILQKDGNYIEAKDTLNKDLMLFNLKNPLQSNLLKTQRVIKITKVTKAEVYDLRLDKIHNFALMNGLFVHNCGALYNASLNAEQFEYDFGTSIETMVTVSGESSNKNELKNQIKVDFEQELQKMLDPLSKKEIQNQQIEKNLQNETTKENKNEIKDKKQKEGDAFKPIDFGMGPAKPYKPSLLRDGIIFWG